LNLQPPPVAEPGTGPVPGLEEIYRADSLHIRIMIYTSFVLLAIGGFFGTLQALDKFQVDLYRFLPGNLQLYYTGLTAHGVVLALLFTGTFIIGFLSLALVHGLALLKKEDSKRIIYTDSRIAMGWVRKGKCGTKLKKSPKNAELFKLIERAEAWLRDNDYTTPIVKWETKAWGEIPADYGRK